MFTINRKKKELMCRNGHLRARCDEYAAKRGNIHEENSSLTLRVAVLEPWRFLLALSGIPKPKQRPR